MTFRSKIACLDRSPDPETQKAVIFIENYNFFVKQRDEGMKLKSLPSILGLQVPSKKVP